MADVLFLTFIGVALVILVPAARRVSRDGANQSRVALGISLALASLWIWLANAVHLVHQGSFFVALDITAGTAFFVGLALCVPKPEGAIRLNQHRLLGHLIMAVGLALTFAHVGGMLFSQTWPDTVLRAYAAIGLRGAATPAPGP